MKYIKNTLKVSILVVYILFIMYILVFRRLTFSLISNSFISGFEPTTILQRINIIPFSTFVDYSKLYTYNAINYSILFNNIVGNIILFVPIGLILPFTFNKPNNKGFWHFNAVAVSISFVIEIGQLILVAGSFDIDDFILRFIGTAIGYLFYKLITLVISKLLSQKAKDYSVIN